jgi:DNA-binding protein HU-beta
MFKRQFISKVANKANLTNAQVGAMLAAASEVAAEQLVAAGEVKVPGLASFKVLERAPRVARNPKTGESYPVPSGHTIKSRPIETLSTLVKSRLTQ